MKPIVLTILDGWGISYLNQNNPIAKANIPNIKEVEKKYPICSLQASGIAVGLPWNEAGNSEVGHLNIGAGRILYQYLMRISSEIRNGNFFKNQALLKTISHANENNSTLHLMGLTSSGNIHSYIDHLYALLDLADKKKIKNLCLHIFTDGRDAPLREASKIIEQVQDRFKKPNWKIATIIGRYYAMDRNKNWDRTQKTYELLTQNKGEKIEDPIKKIEGLYEDNITDPYIEPLVVDDCKIKDNDGIIFFNFREDSARQLTRAFVLDDFNEFPRKKLKNISFCGMTQYEKNLPIEIAYPPIEVKNHLTEYLANQGKKVLKIAETEKYAHVTYFFNGGIENRFPYEERKLIFSKAVKKYDNCPEMQAEKITKTILDGVKSFDLIIANYANTDMIGHTGNLEAGIKAVECIDKLIQPLIKMAENGNFTLIITADHGNVEEMLNLQTGEEVTEHSRNPVPFYLIDKDCKLKKEKTEEEIKEILETPEGMLSDIAPTILELMHISQPREMTGRSLLKFLR